jgi:hypothetical protein
MRNVASTIGAYCDRGVFGGRLLAARHQGACKRRQPNQHIQIVFHGFTLTAIFSGKDLQVCLALEKKPTGTRDLLLHRWVSR